MVPDIMGANNFYLRSRERTIGFWRGYMQQHSRGAQPPTEEGERSQPRNEGRSRPTREGAQRGGGEPNGL